MSAEALRKRAKRKFRDHRRGAVAVASAACAALAGLALTAGAGGAASAAEAHAKPHSHPRAKPHSHPHAKPHSHPMVQPQRQPFAPAFTDPDRDHDRDTTAACDAPKFITEAACFAVRLHDVHEFLEEPRILLPQRNGVTPFTPLGYGPLTLRKAYNLDSSRGTGNTVAIIDAFDDPNAESDLATYRKVYGLSACTTANGCFRKVNQNGKAGSYPSADPGWSEEISLDLDMVSAICPNCHIMLVEASDAYIDDLGAAVNTAVKLGAKFVSNSYGADESSADTTYDKEYFDHPGVAITVSSGDGGYATSYPATSSDVVSVGGTTLKTSSSPRGFTETVWSGSGSGCSSYDPKPSWQAGKGCKMRTDNDVAAVADPDTGVAVYDSYQQPGWSVFGGTSVSSPIIASVYALAGTPKAGTNPASYLYADPSALNGVTSGSNGSCNPASLCHAGAGYNGPTGLGTPNGLAAFTAR